MLWWHWVLLGFIFLILEVGVSSGFFLVFVGVSALVVGLLEYMNILGEAWVSWVVFSVLALGLTALLRKKVSTLFTAAAGSEYNDDFKNEIVIAKSPIEPMGHGTVELRGVHWKAKNSSNQAIAPENRCRVQSVDGLVLTVIKEDL